jgi:hypothetical protein
MLFLFICVGMNRSYEFASTSTVHVTMQTVMQVVNMKPSWITDRLSLPMIS